MKNVKLSLGDYTDPTNKIVCGENLSENDISILVDFIQKSYSNLEGKNKPSTSYEITYPDGTKQSVPIKNNYNYNLFSSENIWHYHEAILGDGIYQIPQILKPTLPFLKENIYGKTCDPIIHYKRLETEYEIIIEIIGYSCHGSKYWQSLSKIVTKAKYGK